MQTPTATSGFLGHGVNRVTDRFGDRDRPGPNVAVSGLEIPGAAGGMTLCSVCRTASELAQAMQFQAGGSLTGLGFLPLLRIKRDFFTSLKTTVYSLSVVVHAWRVTSAASLSEPHLRPDRTLPSSAADLDEFVLLYGDSYIASINLGGEFNGVYTFRSETREQADRVNNELALGGLVSGFQLGVDLHHTLENVSRSTATSYDFKYSVRGVSQTPKLRAEEMVAYAQSFGLSGFEQPALLNMATLGYETVPEMHRAFAQVAANRERFTSNGGLLRQQQRVEELINQIQETQESLKVYGISLADEEELDRNQQIAEADLTTLANLVSAYKASPTSPLSVPSLASLQLNSPHIVASVSEDPATLIGNIEAPNGNRFDFPFDASTAVQNRVRLSGIGLEAGSRIDKLTLRYQSRGEAAEKVFVYGGKRGLRQGERSLGEGEGISAIYAEFGPRNIDKLRLFNGDSWVVGGGGERGDKSRPVNWQRASDQVVLGFTGRSDNSEEGALFALQAVVARFERIEWEPIDPDELLDS
ncbi:hypothetical protein KBZ09_17495 [Cyanobium sp. Cruz CV11-17]|jgi:hypothetical protein|nr:hypothetical protein [Cyanobium sp. Cruz CV11-17]